MRSFALVALLALAGCAGSPADRLAAPAPAPTAGSSADASPDEGTLAGAIASGTHRATNAAREENGLAVLAWDAALAEVARGHSQDMAQRGFFSHDTPDGLSPEVRATRAGLTCDARGGSRTDGFRENIFQMWRYSGWTERQAAGGTTRTYDWYAPAEVAAQTVQGWLDSPGHRFNLLFETATREGIGVHVTDDDEVFITQVIC